jgi:hypothetical protein
VLRRSTSFAGTTQSVRLPSRPLAAWERKGRRHALAARLSCSSALVGDHFERADCRHIAALQAIVYAPNATSLVFDNCPALESVLIWSEQLASLKLPGCPALRSVDARCPRVAVVERPPLVRDDAARARPQHARIREIVTEKHRAALAVERARRDTNVRLGSHPARVPEVFRSVGASRMGCA